MSPTERKAMINRDRTDLSLTKQCKLLKISRSSLYYTPVGVNAETLELMNEIDRVFTKYPLFGSRQIAAYLPRNGFCAGRHRVRRLMGIMGLQAIYKVPITSKKHPSIAIGRSLLDPKTQEYVASQVAQGRSKLDAIRCVKRYIARKVFNIIARRHKLKNQAQIVA